MQLMSRRGFTLAETLVATLVVAVALCGIMGVYVGFFDLLATSKNVNIATNAAQGLMEQIRNDTFTNIADDYDGNIYTVNNMPSNKLVVYVNTTNPELLVVTISVCWKQKNRLFGEDKNLNGILDTGEDTNGNGIIDSTVQLVALVSNH